MGPGQLAVVDQPHLGEPALWTPPVPLPPPSREVLELAARLAALTHELHALDVRLTALEADLARPWYTRLLDWWQDLWRRLAS